MSMDENSIWEIADAYDRAASRGKKGGGGRRGKGKKEVYHHGEETQKKQARERQEAADRRRTEEAYAIVGKHLKGLSDEQHSTYLEFMAEAINEPTVELADRELTIEATFGSGPGGQHRNKNATAKRVVHTPTQLYVLAQDNKSPEANRKAALKRLTEDVQQHVNSWRQIFRFKHLLSDEIKAEISRKP